MNRWKYGLAVVVLVSRLAGLSLCYVSDISDWCWYLFVGGWFVLFFIALWDLFRLRWRDVLIFCLVLGVTAAPAFRVGEGSIARLQEGVFRLYAKYRIQSAPLDQFLRKCSIFTYVQDDGTQGRVGFCNRFLGSTMWKFPCVIYDPAGKFARSEQDRGDAWERAVRQNMPAGPFLAYHDHDGAHLVGDFYFALVPVEELEGAVDSLVLPVKYSRSHRRPNTRYVRRFY